MNVLMVGGAGYVGTIIRPAVEGAHQCTYFDRVAVAGADDRTIIADVNDQPAVEQAVKNRDAVMYLALGKGPDGNYADLTAALSVNVEGLYRFLRASLEASVRRFVYVSSLSVYTNWYSVPQLDERCCPNASDPYGLSKRLGEHVCELLAGRYPEATVIVPRLVAPRQEKDWPATRQKNACALGPNDTRRLFLACLACDRPGLHIFQATGDVSAERLPNRRAGEIVSWKPEGN